MITDLVRRLLRLLRLEHRVVLRGLFERAVRTVLLPLRLVVRRDRTLVALGSAQDRFADNAAHLFLHLSRTSDAMLVPVWVGGSPEVIRRLHALGHRAELRWSRAGVRVALRAGTYVYSSFPSDINPWLGGGASTVCLWHGIPLKRVERDLVAPNARLAAAVHRPPPSYLLSSTEYVSRRCLVSAFGVPLERCWHHGYPRNDVVLAPGQEPDPAFAATDTWRRLQVPGRVVGLFLTWRDHRSTDIADQRLVLDLAETCRRHGATLVYKPHYNVTGPAVEHPSCVVLPADSDMNVHLGSCDAVITDYSAAVFDVLLLGRPVLHYLPDLEDYRRTRGFCFDPEELPGPHCRTAQSLLTELARLLAAPELPPAGPDQHRLREEVWGAYDGHASEAVRLSLRALAAGGRPGG